MLTLEVAGIQYSGFEQASVSLRLDALSNAFSFTATSNDGAALPFRGGEACVIFADGVQVLDGSIEVVSVNGSAESHRIAIQGRDKTGDLLDSSLATSGPTGAILSDIRPPISLRRVIQKVIAHLGADIQVVDLANPALYETAEDLAAPEPGENAFAFLERLARKRQVFLTSNADGAVVITQAIAEDSGGFLFHEVPDQGRNNIISYDASYDRTGRFNRYLQLAQLNATPLLGAGAVGAEEIVSQGSTQQARDTDIRAGRQHVLVSETPSSTPEAGRRAVWERNIRRARGQAFGATVHGFRDQNENLWTLNTLVTVQSVPAGIATEMLVNTIEFTTSPDGSNTTLGLVEKDAYTLAQAEPLPPERNTETLGIGLG